MPNCFDFYSITLVKKGLAWFFERKVIGNTEELKQLRAEKKKILEKVMDKETYKVAVDILNKFGDKSQRTQTQSLSGKFFEDLCWRSMLNVSPDSSNDAHERTAADANDP